MSAKRTSFLAKTTANMKLKILPETVFRALKSKGATVMTATASVKPKKTTGKSKMASASSKYFSMLLLWRRQKFSFCFAYQIQAKSFTVSKNIKTLDIMTSEMDSIAWTAQDLDLLSTFEHSSDIDEFEVRFGKCNDNRFEPGVTEAVFKSLLKFLSDNPLFSAVTTETNVFKVITESKSNALIRGVEEFQKFVTDPRDPSLVLERYSKQKQKLSDNENYGFRLSISKDKLVKSTESSINDLASGPKIFRLLQKRFGFKTPDEEFRIDMSITKTSSVPSIELDQRSFKLQPYRYEVEIESIGENRKAVSNVGKYIILVLKYIQNSAFPITKNEEKSVFHEYAEKYFKDTRYVKEALKSRASWGRLFLGAMPVTLTLANVLTSSATAVSQPNIQAPYPKDYTVTEKADGERCLLFVAGSGHVYLINRECKIVKTGMSSSGLFTLIDGELIPKLKRFLAFDMLFDCGEDIRHLPLTDKSNDKPTRHLKMNKQITLGSFKTVKEPTLNIIPKRFHQTDDVVTKAGEIWRERFSKYSHHVDGIFFTPRGEPYPKVEYGSKTWSTCLKWKPRSLLSIDFAMTSEASVKHHMSDGKLRPYRMVQLQVLSPSKSSIARLQNFNPRLPMPTRSLPLHLTRIEVDEQNRMMTLDPLSGARQEISKFGQIVEFAYDREALSGFEWKPLRIRHDKNLPNRTDAANQIWEVMNEANGQVASDNFFELLKDPLSEKQLQAALTSIKDAAYYTKKESLSERKQSIVINIRNFHTLVVKQTLYSVASKIVGAMTENGSMSMLLELGVGKGGDYNRWRNADIRTVVGIDTDKAGLDALDEMQRRLRQATRYPKSVTSFQADMTSLLSTGKAGMTATERSGLAESVIGKRLKSFDIVSCQFAMHYAFESELKMRGFMTNIYEALKIGGVFIGTVLDGQAVLDLLKGQSSVTFTTKGDTFARITKHYAQETLDDYGQSIGVWFTSIADETYIEYLVNFQKFVSIMKLDYDIELITKAEAESHGLPCGSELFSGLYQGDVESKTRLTTEEKKWSFLNRFFIMKKMGNGNGAVIQKWLKRLI